SLPRLAVQPQFATHEAHQTGTNSQPEPRAAVLPGSGAVRLHKCFKNAGLFFRRDANAGIANGKPQLDRVRFQRPGVDEQLHVAAASEFDCVAYHVIDHLPHPAKVDPDLAGYALSVAVEE